MIYCTLDGKVGYPSTSDKIKLTYENQYVNDSGSYTYDISFPMAISENQILFGNIHRFDVKKKIKAFEECRLYVDNRLVISGKGTVTSISDTTVKVQIVGGKSRIKYNSNFEKHYIDEFDFPAVKLNKGIDIARYKALGLTEIDLSQPWTHIMIDLTTWNYVGQEGVAVLDPVYDETNSCFSNYIVSRKYFSNKFIPGLVTNGLKYPSEEWLTLMTNIAVQPFLMYVLKKVLEYEGYTIGRIDIDKEPWNRLVIASARKTTKINEALPHWTVYKFIDEVRKLFNASFVFDEVEKTVDIVSTNELFNNAVAEYEAVDEYSCEYDEDGLSNIATSNIEYNLVESENRNSLECIPQSVLKKFPLKQLNDSVNLHDYVESLSKKERQTTIFKQRGTYYIYATTDDDSGKEYETLNTCGFFNPLIRDVDSEDTVSLNISPVACALLHPKSDPSKTMRYSSRNMAAHLAYVPSLSNEKETAYDDMEQDEDGEYYITVQDAIDGVEDETEDESEDDVMQVFFQGLEVSNILMGELSSFSYANVYENEITAGRYPVVCTDARANPYISAFDEGNVTLSLEKSGFFSASTIIDRNNLLCIKFISDDIPNPSKIYVFHNKRFVCQKIEMQVGTEGIERLKTGYFYEIL